MQRRFGAAKVLLETSPDNFQDWLNHGRVLSDRLSSTVVARQLASRFGGDHGSSDWRNFGRLAGFTNRKKAPKIEQKPESVLEDLTRRQSTFTRRDIAREVFRYIDDAKRFRTMMARIEGSPELLRLAPATLEQRGNLVEPDRCTTREMLAVEARLAERSLEMGDARTRPVREENREAALRRQGYLTSEQRQAVRFITGNRQIETLTGSAGAGKSAPIAAARDAWQTQGYRVLGGALSGIAAENLQREAGLESRTLASREQAWRDGHQRLSRIAVLVIDEAGQLQAR